MPAQSPNPRFPGAEKVVSHYKQGFSLCLTIFRCKEAAESRQAPQPRANQITKVTVLPIQPRDKLCDVHRELRWVRTLLTVAVFARAASAQVTHFGLTAPANPQAGVPFSLGITALDSNAQTVKNCTGTIALEIGGVFTAPPLFSFTPGDHGALNVPVTLRIAGPVTMVITDTVTGAGGNITVNVLPTHL